MIDNQAVGAADDTTCWGAIAAGAVVACAVTLILIAFGIGAGLSVVSPWADANYAPASSIPAGIYLIVTAMLASTVGGYVTGRLRAHWSSVHADERYFRDTAHGFVTWAFATLLTASVLGGAATHLLAAASAGSIPAAGAGAAQAANSGGPLDSSLDSLLRTDPAASSANAGGAASGGLSGGTLQPVQQQSNDPNATRGELTRILAPATRKGGDVSPADREYAAKVVAARTGLSQQEAQQRVDRTIEQAKQTADAARRAAAKLSFWLAASMLAGALAASLAATEGGRYRSARWYEGEDPYALVVTTRNPSTTTTMRT